MVATGETGGPSLQAALGASFEIVAVKFVKAGVGQIEFASGLGGGKLPLTMCGQKMTDERCRQTFDELKFFMTGRITEEMDLSLWN
jgi:hypothetical protein